MYFNINSGSCAPAESQSQGMALFGAPRMQHDPPSLVTFFFTNSQVFWITIFGKRAE